jgi:membrane protein
MADKPSWFDKLWTQAEAFWDESALKTGKELSRLHSFIHFWVLVVKSFIRNRCPIRASALSYATLLALIPMLAVAISVTSSMLKEEGEDRIYLFIDDVVSRIVPPAGTNDLAPATPLTNAAAPILNSETTIAESGSTNFALVPRLETNEPVARIDSSVSSSNAAPVVASKERADAQAKVAHQIHDYIQNTRSTTLGITGVFLLIIVAIRMLSSIEETFNDIWGVTCGRSWFVRTVIYWTTITLGPLLLAAALGLATGPHLQFTQDFLNAHPFIKKIFFPTLTLVILWLAFALFYKAVPNTKVNFSASLIGGMVGGTVWYVNNLFGVLYVSRVVTYSKVYGSLGLVPVFMAGIYISWLLLLFGAQVAYAFQNRKLYSQERLAENVNQRGREFVALRLMTCIGQRFQRGHPPATIQQMSTDLGIPSRLIQQVLQILIAAHLVAEISGAEAAYAPARPLESINAHHILQAMRATVGQELVTRDEPVREEVYGEFARIQAAEKEAAASLTLLALVHRAETRLELAPPPAPEEAITVSTVMKPSIKPVAASKQETNPISVDSSAKHSSDTSPEPFTHATDGPGNEAEGATEAHPTEPKKEIHVAQSAAPEEEERSFPL